MYQEKVIFALVGVIVGFVANKVYDIVAKKLEHRRIQLGLVEELMSVHNGLVNFKELCEERFERSKSYHDGVFPRQIQFPIYNKYYADICLCLNRSQRSSFEQIYVIVEELNQFISSYFKERCENGHCSTKCKALLATNYATACDLIFLVENHIKHEKLPIIKPQVEAELEAHRREVDTFLKKRGLVPE